MSQSRPAKLLNGPIKRETIYRLPRIAALGAAFALVGTSVIGGLAPASALPIDDLAITPDINFGQMYAGASADYTLEITNTGPAPKDLSDVTIASLSEKEISVVAHECTGILPADGTCEIDVVLHPTITEVPYQVGIQVNEGPQNRMTTLFRGEPVHPFTLNGSLDLNFGEVILGESSTRTILLENTSGVAVSVPEVFGGAGGATGDPFLRIDDCEGDTIFPGNFCTLTYSFTPDTAGNFLETPSTGTNVRVLGKSYGPTFTGTGTVPVPTLEASETQIDFGEVAVGDSVERRVQFTNIGSDPITLNADSGGKVQGDGLVSTQNCALKTLQPGAHCTWFYRFTPTAPGSYTGYASPTYLGMNFMIDFTGTGVEVVEEWGVFPTNLDFEFIPLGSSRSKTITVTNTSGAALAIPAHDLDLGSHFTVDSMCTVGEILGAGETCTITVTFIPTDTQYVQQSAELTLGTSTFTISANGLGVAEPQNYEGAWELDPVDFNFGDVPVRESRSLTATLTFMGEGSGTIFPKVIDLGGPFTVTTDCETFSDIGEGESCTFTFTFTPTAAQSYSGTDTVSFYGNVFNLTATGTGTQITVPGDGDTDGEDPEIDIDVDPEGEPGGESDSEPDSESDDDPDTVTDTDRDGDVEVTETMEPTKVPAATELPKTGTNDIQGLMALTVLSLLAGVVMVFHSRRFMN